jgi:hypothetical protein
MVGFVGQALIKRLRGQLNAIQVLLIPKHNGQWDHDNTVLLDPFLGDITGAVGNQGNWLRHKLPLS